jgi:hypothetical protein
MPQLFMRDGKWLTIEQVKNLENREKEEKEIIEEFKKEELESKPEFICQFCGKKVKSQWHLDSHLKSHSKDSSDELLSTSDESDDIIEKDNIDKILE